VGWVFFLVLVSLLYVGMVRFVIKVHTRGCSCTLPYLLP